MERRGGQNWGQQHPEQRAGDGGLGGRRATHLHRRGQGGGSGRRRVADKVSDLHGVQVLADLTDVHLPAGVAPPRCRRDGDTGALRPRHGEGQRPPNALGTESTDTRCAPEAEGLAPTARLCSAPKGPLSPSAPARQGLSEGPRPGEHQIPHSGPHVPSPTREQRRQQRPKASLPHGPAAADHTLHEGRDLGRLWAGSGQNLGRIRAAPPARQPKGRAQHPDLSWGTCWAGCCTGAAPRQRRRRRARRWS